jgi:hypothetical protein
MFSVKRSTKLSVACGETHIPGRILARRGTALIAGQPVFAGVDEGDMVRMEEDAIGLR